MRIRTSDEGQPATPGALLSIDENVSTGVGIDARELVRAVEQALTRERSSPQVPALLRFVLTRISELLDVVWAAAWVFSSAEEVWKIVASLGLTPEAASVRFAPGSALPCQVGERGTPLMVNDLDKREFHRSVEEHYRMRSALYAPVKIGSRTIGVFAIYSDRRDCYTEPDLELLTAIGEHLGMVVTSAIMEDRARRIAVLEERNRHARDLHDGVHQVLASLKIYADEARAAMLAGDTDSAALILDQFGAMIDEAADELQGSIAALRQQHELLRDVYAVGGRLQRRLLAAGVGVDFRFDKLPLAPAVSDALAWICREATTNILKHSNARRVELQLTGDADTTVLTVRDDGVGISGPGRSADRDLHIGLEVMRERAEEVGGELTISTMDHGGVCVQCRVPTGGVGEPPAPT